MGMMSMIDCTAERALSVALGAVIERDSYSGWVALGRTALL